MKISKAICDSPTSGRLVPSVTPRVDDGHGESVPKLNTDVFYHVLKHLDDARDIEALARASKSLYTISLPFWKSINAQADTATNAIRELLRLQHWYDEKRYHGKMVPPVSKINERVSKLKQAIRENAWAVRSVEFRHSHDMKVDENAGHSTVYFDTLHCTGSSGRAISFFLEHSSNLRHLAFVSNKTYYHNVKAPSLRNLKCLESLNLSLFRIGSKNFFTDLFGSDGTKTLRALTCDRPGYICLDYSDFNKFFRRNQSIKEIRVAVHTNTNSLYEFFEGGNSSVEKIALSRMDLHDRGYPFRTSLEAQKRPFGIAYLGFLDSLKELTLEHPDAFEPVDLLSVPRKWESYFHGPIFGFSALLRWLFLQNFLSNI